jgi:hypothetical protein
MHVSTPVNSSSEQAKFCQENDNMDLKLSGNLDDIILELRASSSGVSLLHKVPYSDIVSTVTTIAQEPVRLLTMRDSSGFLVCVQTNEQANRLQSLTHIGSVPVSVKSRHSLKGRIIVSDRWLPAEIMLQDLSRQAVKYVKRCGFRQNGRFVPKETVVVTFDTGVALIPETLRLGNANLHVLPYYSQTPQCYQCGRVGHVAKYCFSKVLRCYRCGGQHLRNACNSKHSVCQICHKNHETMKCPSRSLHHIRQSTGNLTSTVKEVVSLQEDSVTEVTAATDMSMFSSTFVEASSQTEDQVPTVVEIGTQTSKETPLVETACQTTPLDQDSDVNETDTQTCWTIPLLSKSQEDEISSRILTGIVELFKLACDESVQPSFDDEGQDIFAAAFTILMTTSSQRYGSFDDFFYGDMYDHLSPGQKRIFHFRYDKLHYNKYFLVDQRYKQLPCVEYSGCYVQD